MGKVIAVCISDVKGVQKQDIQKAYLKKDFGVQNDAHGGDWHRQVSLLSYDMVSDFNNKGAGVNHGDFGENLLVEGIDFKTLPVGTKIKCGESLLEITQIGKNCHTRCQIYHKMGDCIMPREGVFAKVLEEGYVQVGDIAEVLPFSKNAFTAAVLTLSDKGAKGERKDESGPIIKEMLQEAGYIVQETAIISDDQKVIEEALVTLSSNRQVDLILTTGGTGFSKRDNAPEATLAIADKLAPGIAEAIRYNSLQITGRAMLSRGVSVIRGGSVIINLPGSPKAVKESLEYILPHLKHGLEILEGSASECATQPHNS